MTLYWLAVAAVIIISTARITRLLTIDKFPPIKAVRTWYETKTDGSDWQWLTMCSYCMGVWVAPVIMVLAYYSGIFTRPALAHWMTPVWWLVFGSLAVAYVAAIFVVLDQDPEDA